MIRKAAFVATVVIIMLLSANKIRASESVIVNGSFEDNGYIADITVWEPNGWADVNVPAGQFRGWIFKDWVTDASYNLTLCSYWDETYEANDIATVSQWVNLADVNEIVFDLKLAGYDYYEGGVAWDPNRRTAFIRIDDNPVPVWNSDDSGPDANDEYHVETVNISGLYDDRGLHKLSLGIKVDVNEPVDGNTIYYTFWDSVRFDRHCGGNGFLAGDFSRDCYVDMNDLEMLTEVWLNEVDPNAKYNLCRSDETGPYGIINFADFAIFAQGWDGNMVDLKAFAEVWLDEVEPGHKYNLYRGDDEIFTYGTINFADFAIFAQGWDGNMVDLKAFVEVWLDEVEPGHQYNLYQGDDIYPVGVVNFLDFGVFAGNWMSSSYD